METATPIKKKLRHGDRIVKVINDDLGENLYRVRTSEQTTGFFRRFNNMDLAARPMTILILTSVAVAFLFAFVTVLVTKSFGGAISAFIAMLLISAPFSAIFSFFYPLYRANAVLASHNCALIGEEAVEEYAEEKTVIFNDTDLYNAEKCAQISVREGDNFRRDIELAEILLRRLGGTLGEIGLSNRKIKPNDPAVAFVRIATSGIEAVVDNQHHILLGSSDFLRRSGVRVPKESSDKLLRRAANVSIMYVAIGGELKLSYELEYKTNAEFESVIEMLGMDGTLVSIRSYDPNLTDTFVQSSRNGMEDVVDVVRPGRFEEDAVEEVVDTGAVALGRRSDVALPLHAAKHICDIRRRNFYVQLAASIVGAGLMLLFSVIGLHSLLHPVAIAGYQLACTLFSAIGVHLALNPNKLYTK